MTAVVMDDEETTTHHSNIDTDIDVDIDNDTVQQRQDQQTQAQLDAISEDIKKNQVLTSELKPITELASSYKKDAAATISNEVVGFLGGCHYLSSQYTSYRTVRGDGNCFYRAFLYGLVENLCNNTTTFNSNPATDTNNNNNSNNTTEFERIRNYIVASIDTVVTVGGYNRFAIEMFHDEMVDLFTKMQEVLCSLGGEIRTNRKEEEEEATRPGTVVAPLAATVRTREAVFAAIHKVLNEENGTSDYCVWYLRAITATYLKQDPTRFVHYLNSDDTATATIATATATYYTDVPTYCAREIDPMGKDCTMVGIVALAEAFQVQVDIEYMDGRNSTESNNTTKDTTTTSITNDNNKLVKHSFGKKGDEIVGSSPSSSSSLSSTVCISLLYRPGHYDILYKN